MRHRIYPVKVKAVLLFLNLGEEFWYSYLDSLRATQHACESSTLYLNVKVCECDLYVDQKYPSLLFVLAYGDSCLLF